MAQVSAPETMMWSQLGNEDNPGRQRDHVYASYSNSLTDLRRRIRSWIRNSCLAFVQASLTAPDVFALYCEVAFYDVRACPPGILNLRPGIEARCNGWMSVRVMAD